MLNSSVILVFIEKVLVLLRKLRYHFKFEALALCKCC